MIASATRMSNHHQPSPRNLPLVVVPTVMVALLLVGLLELPLEPLVVDVPNTWPALVLLVPGVVVLAPNTWPPPVFCRLAVVLAPSTRPVMTDGITGVIV